MQLDLYLFFMNYSLKNHMQSFMNTAGCYNPPSSLQKLWNEKAIKPHSSFLGVPLCPMDLSKGKNLELCQSLGKRVSIFIHRTVGIKAWKVILEHLLFPKADLFLIVKSLLQGTEHNRAQERRHHMQCYNTKPSLVTRHL